MVVLIAMVVLSITAWLPSVLGYLAAGGGRAPRSADRIDITAERNVQPRASFRTNDANHCRFAFIPLDKRPMFCTPVVV